MSDRSNAIFVSPNFQTNNPRFNRFNGVADVSDNRKNALVIVPPGVDYTALNTLSNEQWFNFNANFSGNAFYSFGGNSDLAANDNKDDKNMVVPFDLEIKELLLRSQLTITPSNTDIWVNDALINNYNLVRDVVTSISVLVFKGDVIKLRNEGGSIGNATITMKIVKS